MTGPARNGSAIVAELLTLTTRMLEQRHDADFLIEGVEQRQALIDEYDAWSEANEAEKNAFERQPEAKSMVEKILGMDQVINKSLSDFKAEAQQNVRNSNAQQKVIGYLGNAVSASGSYMDFKK